MNFIESKIRESISAKEALLKDEALLKMVDDVARVMTTCYREHQGVIYFMGNGGSAADSQHLAAEFVSRFYLERKGLPSQALTVNTSILTAIANDYEYEKIFERQVEAFVKPQDVVVGLSTSGNSKNVVAALKLAKELGAVTVGFTGQKGGAMKELCDYCLRMPSNDTPRIQECHILLGHILCEVVEREASH